MYTQTVLLLFALRSISAYTLVQLQDNMSTRKPQERPIVANGSVRPFTNSHAGCQFAYWERIEEHQEPRDDKVRDKIITNSDISSNDDADYDSNTFDEHDEIDKVDDNRQAKEIKDQILDEIKEKYKKQYPRRFIKRIMDEPMEKVRRRRQFNYYQPLESSRIASGPVLRDEYGNILHDNINAVFSVGHLGNTPRSYGNLRNDQGYSYRHFNSIPNEPIYNQYITQPNQQKPVETHTVNNYPYKTVQQSPQDFDIAIFKPMYNQPTNEDIFTPIISQPAQQRSVEKTQTINNYLYNPIQQSPQEVELTKSKPMYNQPTNEAMNNQHISQPVQQKPVEVKTVNKNPYKPVQQSLQEAELTNGKPMLPIQEITEIENRNKLNQAHEVPKQNKNITQIFEKKIARNNVEVNRNVRNNKDNMINNVNQISKKIGSIKEKVKDRLATANLSGILTSPGGRKLLQSYGIIPTGKEEITKNISARITEFTSLNSDEVILAEKSEQPNNTIVTREDTKNINDSFVEVSQGNGLLMNEQIESPVENVIILNTENLNNSNERNETDTERVMDPLCTEILNTTQLSTTPDETKSKEEYPARNVSVETFNNETSITETQEETYRDLTEEHEVETGDTDRTAKDENEENFENKENYNTEFEDGKKFEILNLDEFFNRGEFWEWLLYWTTAYMEILNEKIETLVKEEVAEQMEELYLVMKTELIESLKQSENNTVKDEILNGQENKNQSTET